MNKERYTIKDIARMANVSRGTVDRVIHGRGKVSKSTYEKVRVLLDKIDYEPNLVAQALRKGELFTLAAMLPDYKYDIFWKRSTDGIDSAVKDYSSIGIKVDKFLFNPGKSKSFKQMAGNILEKGYDGILMAPFFFRESLEFFEKCRMMGLPYVTFNTYIEESEAVCHIGQDLIQSGRTAASLMLKLLHADADILIFHVEEVPENARHMQEKEKGFVQFITENNHFRGSLRVLKINNVRKIDKLLLQALNANSSIQGIYVSTSKVHAIAEILERHSISKCLIGYDLLDENIRFLNSGAIDFLIYQNPGLQTRLGISTLVDQIVFKMKIPTKKILPVEIVMKENIENYLQ